MSAQGATLGRGTVHIPIWPVAVVVRRRHRRRDRAVTFVDRHDRAGPAGHGRDRRPSGSRTRPPRSVSRVPWPPSSVGISHVTPKAVAPVGFVGLENPAAYPPGPPTRTASRTPSAYAPSERAPAVAGSCTGRDPGDRTGSATSAG